MKNRSEVITIIELDFHSDNLVGLIDSFSLIRSNLNINLNIVTKSSIFQLIQHEVDGKSNINWLIYDDLLSHRICIKKSLGVIKTSNYIFLNTLNQSVSEFSKLPNVKILLRVHNSNRQFMPLKSLNFNNGIKLLKFFFKEILFNNYFKNINEINKKVTFFLFPEPEMQEYAINKFEFVSYLNSRVLPLKNYVPFELNTSHILDTTFFKVAIIGSIHSDTRNVKLFEDVIFSLSKENLPNVFIFKFLGNIKTKSGIKLMKKFGEINNPSIRFEFHEQSLQHGDLIHELKECHCIFSPLKINCTSGVFNEIYGKTKTSGNISDIVYSPQPVLIPDQYFKSNTNETFLTFKNTLDAVKILLQLASDRKYLLNKSLQAKEFVEETYGKNQMRLHLERILFHE